MTAHITKIVDGGIAPVKVKEGGEYTLGRIIIYVSINDAAPVPIVGHTHPDMHDIIIRYLKKIQWAVTQNHNRGRRLLDLASIDRSTKHGFVKYMQANPVYFEQLFGEPATETKYYQSISVRHACAQAKSIYTCCLRKLYTHQTQPTSHGCIRMNK